LYVGELQDGLTDIVDCISPPLAKRAHMLT
jgi:hypothetical protein